jgi:hypothetical protein
MAYLGRNDYLGYIIIAGYGMCTYFILKFLEVNFIWMFFATMFASLTAIFIAKFVYNKSIFLKWLFIIVPFIVLITTAIIGGRTYSNTDLTGIWLSDANDGLLVKMRIVNNDSLYLSLSPEFKEVGYKRILKNDTLFLGRYGEIKLRWHIRLNSNNLTLSNQSGELTFKQQK